MSNEFHEEKRFEISLPGLVKSDEANRKFRELGATLYYDVYAFDAGASERRQSETILDIELYSGKESVDAQDDFNEIAAIYPFARRPSSDQPVVIELVQRIAAAFHGTVTYDQVV